MLPATSVDVQMAVPLGAPSGAPSCGAPSGVHAPCAPHGVPYSAPFGAPYGAPYGAFLDGRTVRRYDLLVFSMVLLLVVLEVGGVPFGTPLPSLALLRLVRRVFMCAIGVMPMILATTARCELPAQRVMTSDVCCLVTLARLSVFVTLLIKVHDPSSNR